jgi:hypothetical protein
VRPAARRTFYCLALLLVLGCRERPRPTGPAPSASQASAYRGSLFTYQPLRESLAKLRAATGSRVEALELRIYPDRLVLQARDPVRSNRVLEYVVRNGEVEKPVDVTLKGPGQLEDNLFPLGDVKLDAVPQLTLRALEHVDDRAGRINYVLIRRNLPVSNEVAMRVFISSPIRDGYLDADAEGRPLDEDRAACGRDGGTGRGR